MPYRIHTILTDSGIQFAEQPRNRNSIISRPMRFDMICKAIGIQHRLTKPSHPWTNGQVERLNRTIKDATVKRYHYDSHDQLRSHLADFLDAYNFARRVKTLSGLTTHEYICKIWTSEPDRFIVNPVHQMPALNTWPVTGQEAGGMYDLPLLASDLSMVRPVCAYVFGLSPDRVISILDHDGPVARSGPHYSSGLSRPFPRSG